MQLRFASTLTFEQYVTTRAWEQATLAACPLCAPGKCRLEPLAIVGSLLPELFAGVERSVRAFRKRLGTSSVLVALRGICERHLHALPLPLGLNPRMPVAHPRDRASRQSMGPDPPAEAR